VYGRGASSFGESYNNVVKQERGLPIFGMIKEIYARTCELFGRRSREFTNYLQIMEDNPAPPYVNQYPQFIKDAYVDQVARSTSIRVLSSSSTDRGIYGQVASESTTVRSYNVHINSESCECGVGWRMQPMACKHAFALATAVGCDKNILIPSTFNHQKGWIAYSQSKQRDAAGIVREVNTIPNFAVATDDLLPPRRRRGSGRPRKRRYTASRYAKKRNCGSCGQLGHYSST